MKRIFTLFVLVFGLLNISKAQLTLLHYWNFNNFTTVGVLGDPTQIPPITADYSIFSPISATLYYTPLPGVSSAYQSYWDFLSPGDTTNCRNGAAIGNCLRPRYMDSMQLKFQIPSTGYKNMVITYVVERSGSGPQRNSFAYSVDGGNTWKTTGLNIPNSPVVATGPPFDSISVSITDPLADNNPNLYFRIVGDSVVTALKGNNRFDNITVEGTKITVTPVKLLSFKAAKVENQVNLTWSYTNPLEVKNFELEHSTNGKEFITLTSINFINNNSNIYNEAYTDGFPTAGVNYYRLKTIDKNGTYSYSEIVRVLNSTKLTVSVSPNPVKDVLHISHNLNINNLSTLSVYSLEGKKLLMNNITVQTSDISMNIENLKSGTYILVIDNKVESTSAKFIKQ